MSTTLETLPLSDTKTPETQEDLAAVVREAVGSETAIYPIGGGTSLEYGMPVTQKGWGVSLAGLKRCVDYPARDMTITVEAGITMAELTATLATENQRLPIDAAQAETATLGGVVATNFSGPRRFGSGTMRDYVIGISAVDGRGTLFKGGGRVVKNVAGYDFCKLLTGSLGTLAIISQVTLKVKPIPEASAFLTCDVQSFEQAEKLLAALITSQTTPAAVELLSGPAWDDSAELGPLSRGAVVRLLVGLEGTRAEVSWMLEQLASEWQALGVQAYRTIPPETAPEVWRRLTEFPVEGDAPLVLKVNVRPSRGGRLHAIVAGGRRAMFDPGPGWKRRAARADEPVLARNTETAGRASAAGCDRCGRASGRLVLCGRKWVDEAGDVGCSAG